MPQKMSQNLQGLDQRELQEEVEQQQRELHRQGREDLTRRHSEGGAEAFVPEMEEKRHPHIQEVMAPCYSGWVGVVEDAAANCCSGLGGVCVCQREQLV
ncbi:hypothetical protein MC885_011346 [Smutsia gigantea]|nr:hypothetical protein MC885_011346 [Smutsia gigantea]